MTVASFFAGCGGLDLGFEQAGFQVVWANEFEPRCRATYIRNHPNTEFVLSDICKIDAESIPACDGFIGGPPCQSWSVGGKQKGLDDARGQLFLKYIELINAKKPKFFVIENVRGMLDERFKNVFEEFIHSMESIGYDVKWSLLDAADYDVPQNRERIFFVGFKKELNISFIFPKPTCHAPITLRQAIGDITETPVYYSGTKTDIITSNIHRPNHDVLESKFGSFYYRGNRRRGWQQPSFTINATADFAPLHPSSPKMICFGHENWRFQKERMGEYRRLSVRECARIQTFPDNFIFEYENIKDAYKMIGNAVPPRLARVIAMSILEILNCVKESAGFRDIENRMVTHVLVGYCKGNKHKQLILTNRLYYVRSDGRKGSMFKEDYSFMPKYLLLHQRDKAEVYELDAEEAILADSSFLKALGFETSGETYLCFKLKSTEPKDVKEFHVNGIHLEYNQKSFSPYFITIDNKIQLNERR